MLVETNVTAVVLLMMMMVMMVRIRWWSLVIVAMVPIHGMITAAASVVVLSVAGSLVCVGAVAARPLAQPDLVG